MTSLLTHIAIGGIGGAAGAVLGGLSVLLLRVLLNKASREREIAAIRELGFLAVVRQALFEESQGELLFESDHSRQAAH